VRVRADDAHACREESHERSQFVAAGHAENANEKRGRCNSASPVVQW
jgi:hypothetical protein